VSYGWLVLLICFLTAGTLFFSVNVISLRIFSRIKLQDAFKTAQRKDFTDSVVENSEKLILTCAFYRFVFNMFILFMLLASFSTAQEGKVAFAHYLITFIIAGAIFSVFSLAIPHAWAKYSGEKILSRTFRLLEILAVITFPVLYILQLYDGFVRRLAGVTETTLEEQQEEKEEESDKEIDLQIGS